jgi:hypothetical protein
LADGDDEDAGDEDDLLDRVDFEGVAAGSDISGIIDVESGS